MKLKENIELIKRIFDKHLKNVRYIKIAGSQYQENGLPDMMILRTKDRPIWVEVKRDIKDKPTKLQLWNITDLRNRGVITGFIVGDMFYTDWPFENGVKLEEWANAKNK